MAEFFRGIPIIDDSTGNTDFLFSQEMGRGYVPRNYAEHPPEMFSPPGEIALIPESEDDARWEESEKNQSSLEHIRNRGDNGQPIPYLDQGPIGYCWAHSSVHAVMLARAAARQPYVPLSAYSVAAPIKGGKDEGGWCGLSLEFMMKNGVAPQSLWPQGNRQASKFNEPSMKAAMLQHRVTEECYDLTRPVYGQVLTLRQLATRLMMNIPCAIDLMWWGHSVCALRWVRIEAGAYGVLILNSWAGWGQNGTAILRGSKMKPDGAIAVRSSKYT